MFSNKNGVINVQKVIYAQCELVEMTTIVLSLCISNKNIKWQRKETVVCSFQNGLCDCVVFVQLHCKAEEECEFQSTLASPYNFYYKVEFSITVTMDCLEPNKKLSDLSLH